STPISLTAGKEYWVRALLKEGGGDDYLQVGWRTPKDSDLNVPPTEIIGGQYLRTIADPTASITFTQQPADVTTAARTPASFSVAFTAFSAFGTNAFVQWQNAPGGSSTFADIPGATSTTYGLAFASTSDNGTQFRANVTAAGQTVSSTAAALHVS